MFNNKGQALVEFVVVVPILLIIVISIVDYGNILYQKYQMENLLDNVVELYENSKNAEIEALAKINKFTFESNNENELITIKITKKVKVISPGINIIIGNPYIIEVERVIYEK